MHSRQQLIIQLQQRCDELESNLAIKFAIMEESAKATSALGKMIDKVTPVKIVEPIGDLVSVFNSSSGRVYTEKKEMNLKLFSKQNQN